MRVKVRLKAGLLYGSLVCVGYSKAHDGLGQDVPHVAARDEAVVAAISLADGILTSTTLEYTGTLQFNFPPPSPVKRDVRQWVLSAEETPSAYLSIAVCYSSQPANPGLLPLVNLTSSSQAIGPIPLDGLLNVPIVQAVESAVTFTISSPTGLEPMSWGLSVGISRKGYVLATGNSTGLIYDDTDSTSILVRSAANASSSLNLFYVPSQEFNGYPQSYCSVNGSNVDMKAASAIPGAITNTTRGSSGWTRTQFLLPRLSSATNYTLWLMSSGPTPLLYQPLQVTTKTSTHCQILTNVPSCPNVGYAVPASPSTTSLATFYDTAVSALMQNFTVTLAQYPCTDSRAMYSYVRGCDDCANAYRNWLCATMIPRCTDEQDTFVPMAARDFPQYGQALKRAGLPLSQNSSISLGDPAWDGGLPSRNSAIDMVLAPGPYGEVLPCIDLCYEIVRSCPVTVFGFQCPLAVSDRLSYGYMADGTDDTVVAVNASAQFCNPVTTDEMVNLQPDLRVFAPSSAWSTLRAPSLALLPISLVCTLLQNLYL